DLEADQRVEEFFLLLERRVARADVRRLAVDALVELAERDRDVVDLRERRLELLGALRGRAPRPTAGPRRRGLRLFLLLARDLEAVANADAKKDRERGFHMITTQ